MGDVVEDPYRRVGAALAAGGIAAERDTDELAAQAELALELARRFADRPEGFEELAGRFDHELDEWLLNLPADLARAGMVEQAVRVADAVSGADERYEGNYACDPARILIEAGRTGVARARVQANLRRFGESPYTWMTSGESLVALGDLEGARGAYEKAAEVVEERDDPTEVSDALEQLASFFDEHRGAKSRVGRACQRVRVTQDPEGWVVVRTTTALCGFTESVPRNAPCPCGSGRECKRCCGSPR